MQSVEFEKFGDKLLEIGEVASEAKQTSLNALQAGIGSPMSDESGRLGGGTDRQTKKQLLELKKQYEDLKNDAVPLLRQKLETKIND